MQIGDVATFLIFLPEAWQEIREIRVRALLWQQSYFRPHHLTKAHERRYLFSSLFVIFGDVFAIAAG